MKSVFSYDSPVMQILMYIGDLIILNFIYLICCLPIFTIGAAQAGMYTAMRVLNDKEDDSSPAAAFFRGFASGFGKVTLAWGIMSLLLVVVAVAAILGYGALSLPSWLGIVAFSVVAVFQTLVPAFHSRFGCTAMQLIRNSWFLLVAHPFRSIGTAALVWIPGVLFMTHTTIFMTATPIWGTLYFSTAFLFGELFLRKPFKTLIDDFNEKHPQPQEDPESKQEKVFSDTLIE